MKIWLDDIRCPPDETWAWAYSYDDFRALLSMAKRRNMMIEVISFDHDLGELSRGLDGYDCIKLCASADFCEQYPQRIEIHSANPVGAENIRAYDQLFRKFRSDFFASLDRDE